MTNPWANTFILTLAAVSLGTGFAALITGSPEQAWMLHFHRVAGFAVAAVLLWKLPNVVAPLVRRRGAWGVQDLAALLLLTLVVTNLGLGVVWAHVGSFSFGRISGISWHINAAVAVVPLLAWHLVRYRRLLRPRYWAERRSVLRLGGLMVAGFVLWRVGSTVDSLVGGEPSTRRFTGSYPAGDFTGNAFPTTSWLNDHPPRIDRVSWRLSVGGAVNKPLILTLGELEPPGEMEATLDCTGGWHSTQRWKGVLLGGLIDLAEPEADAASVSVVSATGYYRRVSMRRARDLLLATHVGDALLSHGHGAPLRLVVPGKRGFEWVKWVTRIEVNRTGSWLQPPLPLQ